MHLEPTKMIRAVDHLKTLIGAKVEVKAKETTHVELTFGIEDLGPSTSMSGTVRLNNEPLPGVELMVRATKRFTTITDSKGYYTFKNMPVGQHYLTLDSRKDAKGQFINLNLRRYITLEQNAPQYEDFDILTGSISGAFISEETNLPTSGYFDVSIRMFDKEAPYEVGMDLQTQSDGTFQFQNVPVGVYEVTCNSRNMACFQIDNVKVFPGRDTGLIHLKQRSTIIVAGRVVFTKKMQELNWLGMTFMPIGDKNGRGKVWVKVIPEIGEFKTERLSSGRYSIKIYDGISKYPTIETEIPPGGVSDLMIVPLVNEG